MGANTNDELLQDHNAILLCRSMPRSKCPGVKVHPTFHVIDFDTLATFARKQIVFLLPSRTPRSTTVRLNGSTGLSTDGVEVGEILVCVKVEANILVDLQWKVC